MSNILFDASSHLGQFCLDDESVRIGCKNMQVGLADESASSKTGAWTDLENGRVDRTIWKIPRDLQEAFYPYMDHFFSVARVDQFQATEEIESIAYELRNKLPKLSFYSRFNLATGISQNRSEIYTLFAEMFDTDLQWHLSQEYGISIHFPRAVEEIEYTNPQLERFYQSAVIRLRAGCTDLLGKIADSRMVLKK